MKLATKLLMTLVAAAIACTAPAANITAKGSDTLVILAQKWAETYMGEHPDVKIQVTGGGSGTGFAALQNQQTDLCNASRKIKAKEIEACIKAFGKRPTEYKVALDGLSVYVNESNPLKEITLEQLDCRIHDRCAFSSAPGKSGYLVTFCQAKDGNPGPDVAAADDK